MPTKAALRWLAIAMIIQAGFGLLQIAFGRVDLVRLMSEGSNKQSYGLIIACFFSFRYHSFLLAYCPECFL
ncbi:hypothetical protein A6X21_16550 [Planctopirus hydrillae]|uniref:Uncharacterized protein n=1 Tax=Planctopirus hydrillae TaxID=1841610 RepID=A0A1C3EQA4_9PLAN|nr:hypothetical protein A6X21_16550 [Planctopirus hydrillae]